MIVEAVLIPGRLSRRRFPSVPRPRALNVREQTCVHVHDVGMRCGAPVVRGGPHGFLCQIHESMVNGKRAYIENPVKEVPDGSATAD